MDKDIKAQEIKFAISVECEEHLADKSQDYRDGANWAFQLLVDYHKEMSKLLLG